MLHASVQRELFGTSGGRRKRDCDPGRKTVQISGRQVAVVLLMIMILSSWALDSFQVQFVPRRMHDSVASLIDSGRESFPTNSLPTSVDTIVAHNPLDDSPITFGSVVLLGVICAVGLGVMALTAGQKKPE